MPANRPRSRSGIVWFHIVMRKMPLTMSAPPAMTRLASASQRSGARPNAMMARPHTDAATMIASPWRWTRLTHPLATVASSEPTAGAV
jgi:hypothetical protein